MNPMRHFSEKRTHKKRNICTREKIRSLGSILWGPWISDQNLMTAHLLLVEIYQSTVDNQPANRPSIIIHFDAANIFGHSVQSGFQFKDE